MTAGAHPGLWTRRRSVSGLGRADGARSRRRVGSVGWRLGQADEVGGGSDRSEDSPDHWPAGQCRGSERRRRHPGTTTAAAGSFSSHRATTTATDGADAQDGDHGAGVVGSSGRGDGSSGSARVVVIPVVGASSAHGSPGGRRWAHGSVGRERKRRSSSSASPTGRERSTAVSRSRTVSATTRPSSVATASRTRVFRWARVTEVARSREQSPRSATPSSAAARSPLSQSWPPVSRKPRRLSPSARWRKRWTPRRPTRGSRRRRPPNNCDAPPRRSFRLSSAS